MINTYIVGMLFKFHLYLLSMKKNKFGKNHKSSFEN